YEADLFAWQLCRNAGIAQEQALDALRCLALQTHPRLKTADDYRPAEKALAPVLLYYLSSQPEPLIRLKRLFMERDGLVADEKTYGLFRYAPAKGEFSRCDARSVSAEEAPFVFIHGLRGGNETFRAFLDFLSEQKELAGRPLLSFRYPNNDSLARSGTF